jgi:hypothetical protein
MRLGRTFSFASTVLVMLCLFSGACQKNGAMAPTTAPEMGAARTAAAPNAASALSGASTAAATPNASVHGAAGQMPAYYHGTLFTVNMMQLPDDASAAIIARNPTFNEIYATNDLDDEQDFVAVIDAIQGDGFNPLWRQNLIHFNAGFTPHQFTSDDEVLSAASGSNPEITIEPTDEIYRCAVVGKK